LLHTFSPQETGSTHLGYSPEVVHPHSPEKRETWRKGINIDTSLNPRSEVLKTIGQGIGKLNIGGCPCSCMW
jgi:hypothetical protein